jgi:hypothetical protein
MIGGRVRADAVGLSVDTSAVTRTAATAAAVVSRSPAWASVRLLSDEILYLPRNARLRCPGAFRRPSELGHR